MNRMDHIVDNASLQIARRVKLEREARGWSQADLADAAGIAKASVSKIERGEMSPTAVMLVRLSSAFGLTLAGLLVRAESGTSRVSRHADQPVWTDPATGYKRRQIYLRPDHPIEYVEVELPAGAEVRFPAHTYVHIRQILHVTDGDLVIVEGESETHLSAGDCLGFGAPSDVIFANRSDRPCRYLVSLIRS